MLPTVWSTYNFEILMQQLRWPFNIFQIHTATTGNSFGSLTRVIWHNLRESFITDFGWLVGLFSWAALRPAGTTFFYCLLYRHTHIHTHNSRASLSLLYPVSLTRLGYWLVYNISSIALKIGNTFNMWKTLDIYFEKHFDYTKEEIIS